MTNSMTAKRFIDTNVAIDAYDDSEPTKQAIDTAELKLIAQPRLEVLRVDIAARPVTAKVKVTLG